jgi:glycine hydroxymethyltransferase
MAVNNLLDCHCWHSGLFDVLRQTDVEICRLIEDEYDRQQRTLQLVAAENQCSRAVLAALGSVLQNKTAEGPVADRLHGGCAVVDRIEQLAIERAKQVFGAKYANVQPHSGTQANQIVLAAVLQKGDTILSLPCEQGGHFSHGSDTSITGKLFSVENYCLDPKSFRLDYQEIHKKALQCRPKMIICGASFYPRAIDFAAFRQIADQIGAFLLADISHISGLVMAGAHQSPIDFAHFTTTSTYKCGGPRGGLILMGKDCDNKIVVNGRKSAFAQLLDAATFPGLQGTPYFNHIAAKAVFFGETETEQYRRRQFKIIENAAALAESLIKFGLDVVTGGTDNHLVLVDVTGLKKGLTGDIAQRALEECGIVVDKIDLPYQKSGVVAGIRLGTPIVTKNGMTAQQMDTIAGMIDGILRQVKTASQGGCIIDDAFKKQMLRRVEQLCGQFVPDNG